MIVHWCAVEDVDRQLLAFRVVDMAGEEVGDALNKEAVAVARAAGDGVLEEVGEFVEDDVAVLVGRSGVLVGAPVALLRDAPEV